MFLKSIEIETSQTNVYPVSTNFIQNSYETDFALVCIFSVCVLAGGDRVTCDTYTRGRLPRLLSEHAQMLLRQTNS